MPRLVLYSTSDCHLCEQALRLIESNPVYVAGRFELSMIDIADSDELIEAYGVRIPVLCWGSRELGWPFDEVSLTDFLRAACSATS